MRVAGRYYQSTDQSIWPAKLAGKYKSRKPVPDDLREKVVFFAAEGKAKSHIANQLNIGETTVYRILAVRKKADA
jgi:hypothetical protein